MVQPTDSTGRGHPERPLEGAPGSGPADELCDRAAKICELLARSDGADRCASNDAAILAGMRDRELADEVLRSAELADVERFVRRWLARLASDAAAARAPATRLLDLLRRPSLLRRIRDAASTDAWCELIFGLVDGCNYTFATMFEQRRESYADRALFQLPSAGEDRVVSWRDAAERADRIARGLLASLRRPDARVALLSENRLDMALADLACLTGGIVDVTIPANATAADVGYILRHAGVDAVIVSTRQQLDKVDAVRSEAPLLETVVGLASDTAGAGALPFESLLARSVEVSPAELADRRATIGLDDLATVMYTSGTTGAPKGICFSQRNIVSKRFARALALPEIGDGDRLLCYLPMFHTFGRFLELAGCVFWGATYCSAEGVSIESLLGRMARVRPTVFISIPLKWMQLYEAVRRELDVETADDASIRQVLRRLTGGALRWGLSAAGYLDPDVFRFFQRHGVELLSGFGMTEATGGITMTPPGSYRDHSIGPALPGIETKLADDGELMIRGPYVMVGHLDPPDGLPSFDADGWFHTGDLMERDADGHYRIVDRKKEIYKNIKGQTIAPQKVENLFRDFDSVGRVFLIGDHREYNTALIWPNPGAEGLDLESMTAEEVKAHYRSLVVSANAFLAPFERIVDFAVVDRDLEAARGELTPKGTYRRSVIESNFADTVRLLYRRATVTVGGVEVILPNWWFQAVGITTQDLRVDDDLLVLPSLGNTLTIRRFDNGDVLVGSTRYACGDRTLDLGTLLGTPQLWLGNDELYDFAPLAASQRDRRRRRAKDLAWRERMAPYRARAGDADRASSALDSPIVDLDALHLAALLLGSASSTDGALGLRIAERALSGDEPSLAEQAIAVLRRAVEGAPPEISRRALPILTVAEPAATYASTLRRALDHTPGILDPETRAHLATPELEPERLAVLLEETERRSLSPEAPARRSAASDLVDLLADYGALHPSGFRRIRTSLTRIAVGSPAEQLRAAARTARRRLETGFRAWLGRPTHIAVDPETGREYGWEDVVEFSDEVDEPCRQRLLEAIRSTTMLREAVFLFSRGAAVGLEDILPNGVWIRLLGTDHGKSVFRVAVRTRQQEQHDLAVNLNHSLSPDLLEEEIDWLIVCSAPVETGPLVEEFGGFWPDHQLWTEEFIAGDTLDRAMRALARRDDDVERLAGVWPFAAWSALQTFFEFWNRTGRRLVIDRPGPANVVVPMHDYHSGARLVSIAARTRFRSLAALLDGVYRGLIGPIESEHPALAGAVDSEIVYSALLETVGEDEGLELLRCLDSDAGAEVDATTRMSIGDYCSAVEASGFLPRRLFFAARRYRRWANLNPDATRLARARTLQELFETYRLADLQTSSPEVRLRLFRETVFADAGDPLAAGLDRIAEDLRAGRLELDGLTGAIGELRSRLAVGDQEDYFLARLSFPHLRPEDTARFVASAGGAGARSELVVTSSDREGRPYYLRHALSAKEVARLHRLFVAARLPVQFRPEHLFLVAVSDRGNLIGGLDYELHPEERSAHMDKVVVAEPFQGQGIAGALIEELCNRLRTAGFRSLTTGFFRPQFFYRYGFSVERRYAGLVRQLTPREGQGT